MKDIYELLKEYKGSPIASERAVGRIIYDLSDRRGIKHALHDVDDEIMEEIFQTMTKIVESEFDKYLTSKEEYSDYYMEHNPTATDFL